MGATLSTLQMEVKNLTTTIKKHDKQIFGNGQPGLIQTVTRLDTMVTSMVTSVKSMEASSRRMELSAAQLATDTQAVSRSAKSAQARISQLEKTVKPIINWKSDIILRLSTMGGTLAVVFGGIWWTISNWEMIKGIFK